ncbi:MAG: hypothetical protein IIU63_08330 [Clostridia bacterium]|nr:hypothetical protein [Clostridia bacterium]
MWNYLGPLLLCLLFVGAAFILDLWARACFLAVGYTRVHHHGKTWKRATRHYKTNWKLWQRLLWIPAFAEAYPAKCRALAILAYLHYALVAVWLALYVAADVFGVIDDLYWMLFLAIILLPFTLGKIIYTDALVRGKIS